MSAPRRIVMSYTALAITACLSPVSTVLLAQSAPTMAIADRKPSEAAGAGAVRQVETAHALADWGRQAGDARALIVAARMLAQIEAESAPQAGKGRLTDNGGKAAADQESAGKPTTADRLLDEALALGGRDAAVRQQVMTLRAERAKGVCCLSPLGHGGPKQYERIVPPHTDWTLEIEARGGHLLRVAALGDGQADIDMEVHDPNGYLVCRDKSVGTTAVCATTPAWTGKFTAKVINATDKATSVRLITN